MLCVDVAVNLGFVPIAAFTAIWEPVHVITLPPAEIPELGACSTITVAEVVILLNASTPAAEHELVTASTKIASVDVIVIVSPPFKALVTPILKTMWLGVAPTAVVLTVVSAVHVSAVAPVVVYPV